MASLLHSASVWELTPESFRPIAIEFKKQLIQQVTGFADLVDEHRSSFEALVRAILDRPLRLDRECERWVAALDAKAPESHAESFRAEGIRVLRYWWEGEVLAVSC